MCSYLFWIPFLTFSKEYSLLLSSPSLLIPSSVMVCGFMMKTLSSPLLMKNVDFASGYDGADCRRPKLLLRITRKAWLKKKKDLYEGIGKLPRQPGLQTFVDSWQRVSIAIKKQKIQQSFLHGARDTKIIVQGCQGNQNLRGQDPREKRGASPHNHPPPQPLHLLFFSWGKVLVQGKRLKSSTEV